MSKSSLPIYQERWFESFILLGCFACGWLFWEGKDTFSPLAQSLAQPAASQAILQTAQAFLSGNLAEIFSHADIAPLYPALIALSAQIFESSPTNLIGSLTTVIPVAKSLNFWLYLSSILLVHLFIRDQIRRPYSLIITSLYAIAPVTLSGSLAIAPEMCYTAFSLLALIVTERYFGHTATENKLELTNGRLAQCGVALALAILTLPIGYTLLGAFFLISLRRMPLKKSLTPALVILLCVSPFALRDLYYHYAAPQPVARVAAPAGQTLKDLPKEAFRDGLIDTAKGNFQTVLAQTTESLVGSLSIDRTTVHFSDYAWARWVLGGFLLLGLMFGLLRFSGIGSLYLALYLAFSLLFLPGELKYYLPALPLMLFYFYVGLMRFGEWMKNLHLPVSRITSPAFTVLIAACALTTHMDSMPNRNGTSSYMAMMQNKLNMPFMQGAEIPQADAKPPDLLVRKNARERAQRWLKLNTPSVAKVGELEATASQPNRPISASTLSALTFNGHANSPATVESRLHELRKLDYILDEPAMSRALSSALEKQQDAFRLVYNDAASQVRIWQVLPRQTR